MPPEFHFGILPPRQRALWDQARLAPPGFVLYGGTAIALRFGHRQSVDFDFFSSAPFSPDELRLRLGFEAEAVLLQSAPNTLTLLIGGDSPVKVSYFGGLGQGQIDRPDPAPPHDVPVASVSDLLATKLKVILQRAEAKDYLDISTLLEHGSSLAEGLAGASALYGTDFQAAISLRALSYFGDGDLPSLPPSVQTQLASAAAAVRKIPTLTRRSERIGW
jgi:hypothetical protein